MSSFNDAKNLIKRSQNIFILPSENGQGDGLGASLGLCFALKKIGKGVNIRTGPGKIAEKFQFLTDYQPPRCQDVKDFIVSIKTSGKKIDEMRYEKNEKDLKIYLNCQEGTIEENDISLKSPQIQAEPLEPKEEIANQCELLITFGMRSSEDLKFSERELKLFYELPVLNIDNCVSNENFGEVNLIELTSSLSEISTQFIKTIDENILDKNVSTPLLAGIIWFYQNFKNPRTRPKALETASYLINKGAEHQKIIQEFYKTKPISKLKLWGRALEKLIFNETKNVYQLLLTKKDFRETNTTSKDLVFVIEELKANFGIPRFPKFGLLILWESHASQSLTKGILYSFDLNCLKKIQNKFEGLMRGNRVLFFDKENDLEAVQKKVLVLLD